MLEILKEILEVMNNTIVEEAGLAKLQLQIQLQIFEDIYVRQKFVKTLKSLSLEHF